jgi:hypothetical protein
MLGVYTRPHCNGFFGLLQRMSSNSLVSTAKPYLTIQPVLRIRDVYPGSRIQQQQQKRRKDKIVVIPFFVATNITKLKIILFLNV